MYLENVDTQCSCVTYMLNSRKQKLSLARLLLFTAEYTPYIFFQKIAAALSAFRSFSFQTLKPVGFIVVILPHYLLLFPAFS